MCLLACLLKVAIMTKFEKIGNSPTTRVESLDNPSVLLKLINEKRGFPKVAKEKLDNLANDDPDKEQPIIMHKKNSV